VTDDFRSCTDGKRRITDDVMNFHDKMVHVNNVLFSSVKNVRIFHE